MLKAPPLQTATATIDTLCGRLQSATLLEDRRAAILGLRSFAKEYPASVASGSLRELITTLKRDGLGDLGAKSSGDGDERSSQEGGDVDTIRLILETLLMLFNPDANSPEAGDEIAFFMADEFSMRQDNVALLLSLLDPTSPFADYYSRLYSVQLLTAVCAARPERLQECILSAPLGVSRLVGVLDDGRDAVRNAGLLLLVELTGSANEELRKIVAFEDVFGKLFSLIRLEGGLSEAGIVAQDCLTLFANLIRGSSSNQTVFRESACVAQFAQLLAEVFPPDSPEAPFATQNRERAAWGVLQLLQLFLIPGESSTAQNQAAFFRAGTAKTLCELGFSGSLPPLIQGTALRAAAALIQHNPPIQEQFAGLQVVTQADAIQNAAQIKAASETNGSGVPKKKAKDLDIHSTYIIEALLDLSLGQAQADHDLRLSAGGLIQAYLSSHERIKGHFLQRAIAGHSEHEMAANVLTALLHPSSSDTVSAICASWIVQGLVTESLESKSALAAVQEGDEEQGEDVITSISAFSSNLLGALQAKPPNEKMVVAYSTLLAVLLWDFPSGVDNLLAEGSSLVQALITAIKTPNVDAAVAGLAAVLLGTVYEFSTKDSPIPRRTLAPLLQQKLGRLNYLDALSSLRSAPAIRDSEIEGGVNKAEEIFFDSVFVDLFTLEYTRLRKAIDKDPGIEVLPPSAAEAGVDRDVLDDLRQKIAAATEALNAAQQKNAEDSQKAEQDRVAISRALQTAENELEKVRKTNSTLEKDFQSQIEKIKKEHDAAAEKTKRDHENYAERIKKEHDSLAEKIKREHDQKSKLADAQHQRALMEAKQEAERRSKAAQRELEVTLAQKTQEHERRVAELGNQHRKEATEHTAARQQLEGLTKKHNEIVSRERDLSQKLQDVEQKFKSASQDLQTAQAKVSALESELEETKKSLATETKKAEQLETQNKELKEELKSREAELETERAGFADLEKELESAKASAKKSSNKKADSAELTKLREAVKKAEENEKSAKDELESMLLVMSDMEAKQEAYKAKVKELGGEVTDDEDEEEEDEEDDGGDDDDVD